MRKSFYVFFLLSMFFLLLFLISISSYGQSYQSFKFELDQIVKKAKLRLGPFRILPTVNFKNIGYDNNVYYQREEDNPASDFTGTVSPEIKLYFLFRNYLILSFMENPEYVYYFEQKRERRWNNTLSPAFKFLFLNRFVISGNYSYSNRRRRASSEFDVRANERIKKYNSRLFYETARSTSFGFSWSVRTIMYEDITLPGEEIYLSRALNRKEKNGNFEFYYRIFSESFFFIGGGYTEYKFEHVQSSWRDSSSYKVYSGIRFPHLGRVRGTLSLGYKKLIPKIEEKKGFSGFVGNTGLNFRLARFGFRLNYNRDVHFSYWTNIIFFNEDRYSAGISFYLTKFLRIDYNFNYGEAKYPEPMMLRMPDGRYEQIKRRDIHRAHIVGFVFRIIRNTGIGLMVNFWKRESNYYWENRERMFVGGYITYEF
ncbi:MAG: outer membrane beta-barrel protein [Candidatus Aminicenantes bacterium]|nr:outer membrane beta-barrel protein [Candidatus Aminicenantes bacterium]